MGKMFLTMAAGFAEMERNLIAERTRAALERKRERGERLGGRLPYGFELAPGASCWWRAWRIRSCWRGPGGCNGRA